VLPCKPIPLVKAIDSGVINFKPWSAQRRLLESVDSDRKRIHIWALGRRSGKSTLAAVIALQDCLLRPDLQRLVRPGELRHAVCVATRTRQARLIVSAARSILGAPVVALVLVGDHPAERVASGFARYVPRASRQPSRPMGQCLPVHFCASAGGAPFSISAERKRKLVTRPSVLNH
jgi:hypothetical protein